MAFSAISEAQKSGPPIMGQEIMDILIFWSVPGGGKTQQKPIRTDPSSSNSIYPSAM